MKLLILLFFVPLQLSILSAQPVISIDDEVANRKALVMSYFNEVVTVDENTRRSVSFMMDIFIQSLIKSERETRDKEHLHGVYAKIVDNHILLLSSYLSESELNEYLEAARKTEDGSGVCSICSTGLKPGMDYCVFCGSSSGK